MGSNLPPGITEGMLPGNRSEDMEWEALHNKIDDDCFKQSWCAAEAREIWEKGKGAQKIVEEARERAEKIERAR